MTSTLSAPPAVERVAEAVRATSEAITAAPDSATITPRVTTSLVKGTATQVSIKAGKHAFTIDEPAALAGDDSGASPVEHLLAALGSCQVISYQVWAAKLGIVVDTIDIDVTGDIDLRGFFGLDEAVRPGFTNLQVAARVTGPESRERYEELTALVERHCPVLDVLTAGVPVAASVDHGL